MSPATRDEIVPLWPTWIGQAMLPGAEEHNPALTALVPSAGIGGELFETDHPSVHWLRAAIDASVKQWFEKMRVQPAPPWRLSGSLEALGFGHYRELGNAPGAYLAGMYFVNTPALPEPGHLRSDCLPSHVSLLDPRVGFNALALEGDPNFNETRTLAPVAGMLMMWPGYLRHYSRVHLAQSPWVRVTLRIELLGAQVEAQA